MDGYLRKTHGYINGGELEKLAQAAGYKASNASRRLRVLEEASRGILTTPEHEQAAKILRGSVIEKIEKRGVARKRCRHGYRKNGPLNADRLLCGCDFEFVHEVGPVLQKLEPLGPVLRAVIGRADFVFIEMRERGLDNVAVVDRARCSADVVLQATVLFKDRHIIACASDENAQAVY
jgi:hypothetical protein